jgi:type I pantothenate kinase
MPLQEEELSALSATGMPLSIVEVEEIYLPLTRLINLHVAAKQHLARVADDFVGRPALKRPYIVAIAGSVAVGKSTVARLLRSLLAKWPDHPKVDLVTTDGFLYQTRHLQQAGLMNRKGYPESYDIRRMLGFLADVRATGRGSLPVYSHEAYDTLLDQLQHIEQPDILIFEGLNVLQIGIPAEGKAVPAYTASDFFDFSIYVDAEVDHISEWYVDRFLLLKRTAFQNPGSYFHHLAGVSESEARKVAREIWEQINLPNLRRNILPSRSRADVVIHKGPDHAANELRLRRF